VLAGGQSLIPLLKLRFAAPSLLVDLGRIPGLDAIEIRGDALEIGALARHSEIAVAPAAQRLPLLRSTAEQIADPLVRNLGTLCGSLAHADPRGDWGSAALALGAAVLARSRDASRAIPIDEFFRGPFESALEPGELVEGVRIPLPRGAAGGAYHKLERKVGDYATVAVAAQLELEPGGARIRAAGLGLTAVGPINLRAREAEALLIGAEASAELFAEAGRLAAQEAQPSADTRGSAEYKRSVVEVFVRRALGDALTQARADSGRTGEGRA
jgi:carbon-monoxide dehydrogenase medium subunit